MSPDEYAALEVAALAHLAAGDPAAAFTGFRWALRYPTELAPAELVAALGVLARIVVALGDGELATRVAHASVAPDDVDGLYDLGYHLIEAGQPAIAATVLAQAHARAPGSEAVVTELCAALERDLRHGCARAALETEPALLASSFLCRYLHAWNAAMSGDLGVARSRAPWIAPTPEQAVMAERIARLVARGDRIAPATPLDDRDLRGWHYVIHGGLLLHRSPHGLDDPMRGRYAWLQDAPALCADGLAHLAAVLAAWGWHPPCVYAPPGPGHELVAAAAAARLGVPLAPWPMVGAPAPGLVVAHRLDALDGPTIERLRERKGDQLFYAHAGCWTADSPLAPDVVGLLYQSLGPWATDDVAALALMLVAEDREPADERAAAVALARAVGRPEPGPRERWWAGGPVPSNRFV